MGSPIISRGLICRPNWLAGASLPDGKWLFVNAYAPTRTVAITGPWAA